MEPRFRKEHYHVTIEEYPAQYRTHAIQISNLLDDATTHAVSPQFISGTTLLAPLFLWEYFVGPINQNILSGVEHSLALCMLVFLVLHILLGVSIDRYFFKPNRLVAGARLRALFRTGQEYVNALNELRRFDPIFVEKVEKFVKAK